MLKQLIILFSVLLHGFLCGQITRSEDKLNHRLPTSIKFVDVDKNDTISLTEAKDVFDLYRNNPESKMINEVVSDVESIIVDLIGYLEFLDNKDFHKSLVSKRFIELYYNYKFVDFIDPHTSINEKTISYPQISSELLHLNNILIKKNKAELVLDSIGSLVKKLTENKLKVNGLIDTYYSYDFNKPSNNSLTGTQGAGRVFDRYHNQITISMVQTKFDYNTNKFRAVVDLVYGLGGEIANYGNTGTSLIIKQAFLSHTIGNKLIITAGNFSTHIGYEVIEAPGNFNYSVSNLFANGPFYHTGVKLDYNLHSKIAFMGGVVSGWDKMQDDNNSKSVIGQILIKPNSKSLIYLNWIGGNEAPTSLTNDTIKAYKQLFDLTASFSLKRNFTFAINSAYGINKFDTINNSWGGAALYLQYRFNSKIATGIRAEYFDDSQKVQYFGAVYKGYTFTLFYSPSENLLIKAELRYDGADENVYWKNKNNESSNNQTTLGIAVIGTF